MPARGLTMGVSIDGYAVEGGFDHEDGTPTSFGVAQSVGSIRPSLRSAGTFEHLDDLIRRAASLGCDEVRVTLEWPRLEPRPDEHDDEALERYLGALRVASGASLRAVVVLCDAAWPSWLGQEPWLSAWAPQRFAAHAAWLAPRLEGLARAAVTFRAPNAAAIEGWREARRPPYRTRAAADAASALDGMLVAHQRATEALAAGAPTVTPALVLAASAVYDDAAWWLDTANGARDQVVLGARRARFDERRAARGVRAPRRWRRRSRMDPASLRSSRGWASTPPFEWWLAGEDLDLLAVSLEHAEGAFPLVELGAGTDGWDAQLGIAPRALAALYESVETLHLHGLVSSTGPLERPVGLLEVDQRGGTWTLAPPDGALERRLRSLTGPLDVDPGEEAVDRRHSEAHDRSSTRAWIDARSRRR